MIKQIGHIFLRKKFNILAALIMAAMGVMTQFVASYVVTVILDMIPGAADSYNQTIEGLLLMTPQMILYVCIISPFIEELIFRGLIYSVAARFIPFVYANVFQAVLFGIYHGNIVQGVYAFVLGMFIGYIMYKAGGIIYTFVFHGMLNLTGLYVDRIIGEDASFLKTTVIALLAAAALVYLVRLLNTKLYTS